ncbi:MAG: hypothetical protein IKO42_07980 [Opitutales bacterium]|nr:hypothetical protein [Opitutales bacterium]
MENIKLKDGVFAEIKKVKIIFDIVDENGEAISAESFVQSANSLAEASGEDLDKIEIAPALIKKSVYGSEE